MPTRLLTGLVGVLLASASLAAQPNVVLIVADDMGFGDVGYNGAEIATPHLDQLAAEGIVLDRFYTS
ncbi:MAG: arylsulfatase, partial [Rhodothermaceae bacterium]|nr:arylsulfatase [Rhodothermaceae bacterium]